MIDKFIVTPKEEKTMTLTIRIETKINSELELLAEKSGRSRNELINKGLRFALDNMEFVDPKNPTP